MFYFEGNRTVLIWKISFICVIRIQSSIRFCLVTILLRSKSILRDSWVGNFHQFIFYLVAEIKSSTGNPIYCIPSVIISLVSRFRKTSEFPRPRISFLNLDFNEWRSYNAGRLMLFREDNVDVKMYPLLSNTDSDLAIQCQRRRLDRTKTYWKVNGKVRRGYWNTCPLRTTRWQSSYRCYADSPPDSQQYQAEPLLGAESPFGSQSLFYLFYLTFPTTDSIRRP